ncbi:hypothetical protein OK351_11665 [Glutamicibacter sp. MNS18]|uniref:hypothetical protein n=1 Tax=Glutamicibacter sp. MNS18 TaxID=2989817 RepID=UPI00223641FC|nr:hypothetical protein [Glutamicibacter sp. MNS18]MCW4466156.1 hypothetical protein [Glutamicibacter sp. MNS18]
MIAKVAGRRRKHAGQVADSDTIASVLARPLHHPARTLLCFLVVFSLGGVFYLLSPAKYSARVDVVVVAITSPSQSISERDISIDSAVQILYSDAVLGQTARALDYPGRSTGLLDELTISPLINSRLLKLYVANEDARLAYDAVNLLAQNFLTERRVRLENLAEVRRGELESHTHALRNQIAELQNQQFSEADSRELRRQLSDQITDMEFAVAAIDTIPPEPGFISREAVMPTVASRPPATVYFASSLALAIVLSFIVAPNSRSQITIQRLGGRKAPLSQLFGGINA